MVKRFFPKRNQVVFVPTPNQKLRVFPLFFFSLTVICDTIGRHRQKNFFCQKWRQIRKWTLDIFCCMIVYVLLHMDRALGHDWMLLGRGRDKLSFFQHGESTSKELSGGTTLFMWIYTSPNKCAKNMTPQTDWQKVLGVLVWIFFFFSYFAKRLVRWDYIQSF